MIRSDAYAATWNGIADHMKSLLPVPVRPTTDSVASIPRQRVLPDASQECVTGEPRKDFPENSVDFQTLPRVRPIGGRYRVEIRSGVLMPSPWEGISEFVDVDSGEVLAHFAEFHEWHAIIPTHVSARLAAVAEASPLDISLFSIEASVPFLRSIRPLIEGQQAMARVPLFVKERIHA